MHDSVDVVIPAFNVEDVIEDTINRIAAQQVPDGWALNIFVTDDASTDSTLGRLRRLQKAHPQLHIVESATNGGRSIARNRGVAAGKGSIVILCDADCRFTRDDTIAEFVVEILAGADAVIGLIELTGEGFWARYTNSVTAGRVEDDSEQGLMAYTTQNFAIRRDVFEKLSGYSTDYYKYGFEDRDFLIRLERLTTRVVVREDLRVSHDDDFTLRAVCRKAEESGRYSAAVFRDRFPEHYRMLPYARCDATRRSFARLIGPLSRPLRWLTESVAGVALSVRFPGFRFTRFLVQVAVCAAYFRGTHDSVALRP